MYNPWTSISFFFPYSFGQGIGPTEMVVVIADITVLFLILTFLY